MHLSASRYYQSVLALLLLCVGQAQAGLTIEITKGAQGALPIAIVPFAAGGAGPNEDVAAIVAADLQRSGRFNPMPATDMLERPSEAAQINFQRLSQEIGKLSGST